MNNNYLAAIFAVTVAACDDLPTRRDSGMDAPRPLPIRCLPPGIDLDNDGVVSCGELSSSAQSVRIDSGIAPTSCLPCRDGEECSFGFGLPCSQGFFEATCRGSQWKFTRFIDCQSRIDVPSPHVDSPTMNPLDVDAGFDAAMADPPPSQDAGMDAADGSLDGAD